MGGDQSKRFRTDHMTMLKSTPPAWAGTALRRPLLRAVLA